MSQINRKPEVLLVTRPLTPPWDEASKNFAFFLARRLKRFRFHILVGDESLRLPSRITQHHIYRGASWNSSIQKARMVLRLSNILNKNPNIGIVHFLFTPTLFNTLILKRIVKRYPVKIIQTMACLPKKGNNKMDKLLFADQTLAYSCFTASCIPPGRSTRVIPPFVNFSEWDCLPRAERIRRREKSKWRIENMGKIILFPGEYSRLGAMECLWEGFLKIRNKIPGAKLWMACRIKTKEDKKEEKRFKNIVKKSGLSSSVEFIGKVDNVKELYQVADLVVFPVSSMKGKFDFPFVLLESLACGTPIVTSNVAPLPEIWEGNNGYEKKFVFEKDNIEKFVKLSVNILENEQEILRKELGIFVKQRFNEGVILKEYESVYEQLGIVEEGRVPVLKPL